MLSKREICQRLSSLSSPKPWTQRRAAAASAAMLSSSLQNISEKHEIIKGHVQTQSTAETSYPHSTYSLLAYGVAASTAAAVIHQSGGHENSAHQKLSGVTRRYHKSAHCESNNGRLNNNNHQKQHNNSQGEEGKDSDSFFDLAQQWLRSKNNSAASAGENNNSGIKLESNSTPSTTGTASPEEALLHKLGLMGDEQTANNNDDDDQPSTSNDNLNNNNVQSNNTIVTQMMQSVFNKIQDELQSTIPKSSTSSVDPTNPEATESSSDTQQKSDATDSSDFLSFADNISSFFSRKSSNPDIAEIIQQAQNIANNDGASSTLSSSSSSSTNFLSQVLYFQQNAKSIQKTLESSFGPYISDEINLSDLFQSIPSIAAGHYYLEHQESIKTPSWKRRRHRFQPSVEVMKVNELNEALILSELSYADSVEEVREGLESLYDVSDEQSGGKSRREKSSSGKAQWELLFCDTQSRPNEPSHFLAIQKNASQYDDTLHVLMVVRGTKSMGDLITDAMMEATDYEYDGVQGKAHVGITRSGEYLTKRHKKLLSSLMQLSDKRKLDITLIGHSLGAGAATIAAMNMNSNQFANDIGNGGDVKVSANVIGFGCPALLSQNLSLMTRKFVTTVIADADVIPRSEFIEAFGLWFVEDT